MVLDNFDFDKVHSVMKLLDWKWIFKGVPEVEDLKECAMELLTHAFQSLINSNREEEYAATGGLRASVWLDDEIGIDCKLEFILEES